MYTKILLENLKGKCHLEELGIDGRILKWSLETMLEGVDWINFVQDRNQWQVLVNTVVQIFVA
jgi:hypothetical protein